MDNFCDLVVKYLWYYNFSSLVIVIQSSFHDVENELPLFAN